MTTPVTYVELNSPDLEATSAFMRDVSRLGAAAVRRADCLVAPHGDGSGVDAGLFSSRDDFPRTVPIIRVDSLDELRARIESAGGAIVVEPFTLPGVGRGCYLSDPAALLMGSTNTTPLRDLSRLIRSVMTPWN